MGTWGEGAILIANIATAALFVLCIVLSVTEGIRFMGYDGKMKRGVRVGSQPLPEHIVRFLRRLSDDVCEDNGFIRKSDNAVLIKPFAGFRFRKFGFPYLAYIDLNREKPRLEHRVSISLVLWCFLIAILLLGAIWLTSTSENTDAVGEILAFVFFTGVLVVSNAISTARTQRFIEKVMQTHRG